MGVFCAKRLVQRVNNRLADLAIRQTSTRTKICDFRAAYRSRRRVGFIWGWAAFSRKCRRYHPLRTFVLQSIYRNNYLPLNLSFPAHTLFNHLQNIRCIVARPALNTNTCGNIFNKHIITFQLSMKSNSLFYNCTIAVFAGFAIPKTCFVIFVFHSFLRFVFIDCNHSNFS